ncbi:uncharacterized protein LOC123868854 [Maniola jurtina]|uniref:uncharacterized protein LOC123868854 n=1 Tax=Maniola jurtina TaxID=191418 RepID=UPI001E68AAA1|nr:uncharacterized protein LOC123868854 [Maniola jurtina]
MGHFNWLPKVDRFCWCIRNLRCACFIIIFVGLCTSIFTASLLAKPACPDLFDASSPVRILTDVFRWILFVSEMFLIVSCSAFMLGMFWSLPITADIFIGCALINILILIIFIPLLIIQEQYYTNIYCGWYHSQILNLILYLIMLSYFVVVVNSYKEEM